MTKLAGIAAVLLFVPGVASDIPRSVAEAAIERSVALTFDDLPLTGSSLCDTASVREVTAKLLHTLRTRAVPAMGLVTPGRPCISPAMLKETLRGWRAIGAAIGNHSATHPDLNSTPLESYFADIVRAQDLIDAAGPAAQRWFRAPFLHTGDDRATKDSLASLLEAGGYRIAPVTVDNQEWVYAAVYAVALSHSDETLARRVIDAYLEHLEQSVAYYEGVSMAVFGREIPQTLLLHANQLNADALGGVIDMLAARGYRFISMAEALSDSAYARPDRYVGSRGLSWLLRWAIEDGRTVPPEPREAAWVARAFRERTAGGTGS